MTVRISYRFVRAALVIVPLVAFFYPSSPPTQPTSAGHDGFHKYSIARETDTSKIPYTGVNEVRNDVNVAGIPNDGCQSPDSGHPVYQPEWVIYDNNATNFTEMGTGHQCNDTFRYWYWGYGLNGVWHRQGTRLAGPDVIHRFFLFEGSNCNWYANIDVTLVGSFIFCGGGIRVEAGLESWAAGAVVPSNQAGDLRYSFNFAPYAPWDGRDDKVVNAPMCGFWVNDVAWRNGENTAC